MPSNPRERRETDAKRAPMNASRLKAPDLVDKREKAMKWYTDPTRYMFFTGKGGVGKTSTACATAVHLADQGRRVLLVSTDPASNLADVFGVHIHGGDYARVDAVANLHVMNIDPEAAAQGYRDRVIGPVRGILPEKTVQEMEEQLSGACTTEVAAFDEFTSLLADESKTRDFDHLIFDTAPTGHTLRLLTLPSAWSGFLDTNRSGTSCLGPLGGLQKQREQYAAAVAALGDVGRSTLILVSRPQRTALAEAARTSDELAALGLTNQRLILNGLMPAHFGNDLLATAWVRRDRAALDSMPDALNKLPVDQVLLQPMNIVGVDALRRLLSHELPPRELKTSSSKFKPLQSIALAELIDDIAADNHGLIMVMGKGGVGKTTIASAIAVELAARGNDVHLTTTDPAAHVAATIASGASGLKISRIDPAVETARYRKHVLETQGKDLDAASRALLEEDLRSPCTEEIAVFQAFSRVIGEARKRFVVMDTAPTGHTLLLLDATGSYHRDIMRHAKGMNVVTPLMRLQDPRQTKILIVTLAETTPVLEAAALQEDLRRANIEPWAWVINSSLAASNTHDPLLAARAQSEEPQIEQVQKKLAKRVVLVPFSAEEPVGYERLRELTRREVQRAAP